MSLTDRWVRVYRGELIWWARDGGWPLNAAAHAVGFCTELAGSFFVGLVGYAVTVAATGTSLWERPLAFGMAMAAMHAAFVVCDQCPAVDFNTLFTLTSVLGGYYSIVKGAVGIAAQLAGWSLAGLLGRYIGGAAAMEAATTVPVLSFWDTVLVETLLGTGLALTVVLATRQARTLAISLLVGLAMAAGLAGSAAMGAGASLNLARSFGAAVGAGRFDRALGAYALANFASAAIITALMWAGEWVMPYAKTYEAMRVAAVRDADEAFAAPRVACEDSVLASEIQRLSVGPVSTPDGVELLMATTATMK